MFKVAKLDINRNPFIGLYLAASENAVIYSNFLQERTISTIVDTLKPKITCVTSIGSSYLTGLFSVLNSNGIVVPKFTEDQEISRIKKELGINVYKLDDRFSAVRNNLLANDNACIVNKKISKTDQMRIRDCLGVEVFPTKTKLPTVGSINVVTNKGLLGYNDATDEELNWLSSTLKVNAVRGTCNFGTTATSLGIAANSNGAIVGAMSTGFELGTVHQALSGE